MHWLTFIFGFLAIYCGAGFFYFLATGGYSEAHDAMLMSGIGVVIFALASFINQKRHSYSRKRAQMASGSGEAGSK
jgi:drug/metabolite transporter (DMT)-like permease